MHGLLTRLTLKFVDTNDSGDMTALTTTLGILLMAKGIPVHSFAGFMVFTVISQA